MELEKSFCSSNWYICLENRRNGCQDKIRFIRNLSKRNSSEGEWREEEPGEPSDHEVDLTSVKVVRGGRGFG